MPDFNKYAADTPYVRPSMPKTGMSLIVNPVYDYVNTFPNGVGSWDAGTSRDTSQPYTIGIENPFQGLGVVPIAPGAATAYNEAKRFNDSDMMFIPTRDNEDLYAQQQGFWSSVGSGLGRLVLTTGTKLGTGIGYTAGLLGFGNHNADYGNGFSAWIAGAADNGIAKWFREAEDTVKEDWLPIYQEAADRNKGFFARAATDLNFWTEDFTDGAAFIASAFVPGMAISKLGLGVGLVRTGAAVRGYAAANEAAALTAEGLAGTTESAALLSEGFGAAVEAPVLANTIATGANELSTLPRVLNWIDNAKLARNIDVGATAIINTASEAMFEADGVKKDLIRSLSEQVNPNGSARYTPDQVRKISAKAAMHTFNMNVAALSVSNLWEANLMFKRLPAKGSKFKGTIGTTGVWDDAVLQQKTFGRKLIDGSRKIGEGIAAEGLWEENIQLAIQRLNANSENFDLDFTDKLKGLGKQYLTQTVNALTGNDLEASMNIGLGGLIGGMAGKVLGRNQTKDLNARVQNLNAQVSFFKSLGNIYETEVGVDGKTQQIKIDDSGNPVVDQEKFKSYVASMNNVLNLNKTAENLDSRGAASLARVYRDEVFARYAKAHFDSGLGELLYQKFNDIKSITQEDMVLLGFDPSSKNINLDTQVEAAKQKAEQLEAVYNNITQNTLPMRNDRNGRKFFDITDKMFYLSARGQSLAQQIATAKTRYYDVKATTDSFNEAYNRETDAVVDQYNQLWENQRSASKQADELWYDDNARLLYEQIDQAKEIAAEEQAKVDAFVKENKTVLNRLKKDARGRYLYEYANKNTLPSAKEMERQQIVQAELQLAHNATMTVMSKLADPLFGEKYYDEKFAPAMERQASLAERTEEEPAEDPASDIVLPKRESDKKGFEALDKDAAYNQWSNVRDGSDRSTFDEQIEFALNQLRKANAQDITDEVIDDVIDRTKALKSFGDKAKVRKAIKDELGIHENIGEMYEAQDALEREKDSMEERNDLSLEEEQRLKEINSQLENIEKSKKEAFERMNNEMIVDSSENVKPEDKEDYKEILNKISKDRKRVKKFDDYYEVDGQRFRKVTEVIGDTIPFDQRATVQNAINAGYTVDLIVKAFFAGEINDEFRAEVFDKISDEALENMIKTLTKIRTQLRESGTEIIGNNIFVFDSEQQVAGEIDLLAVDKNGQFKIFEIQARRPEVYKAYGRSGKGIKIRELDQQRLSAYRNLFANQYGAVPTEISVMFPFAVTYDKTSAKGFIEKTKLKEKLRFPPARSVSIKRKVFEALRIGSAYDSIDLTRVITNTFLTNDDAKGKMRFLMRNMKFADIKKGVSITVRKAEQRFLDRYEKQQEVMKSLNANNQYNLTRFPGFDNLYSMVGQYEVSVNYDGTLMGYMSPAQTLAYRDETGAYQILSEQTDVKTYAEVTGNSESTYPEFKRISRAYKSAYGDLIRQLEQSGQESITLTPAETAEAFDVNMSQGELDKVPQKEARPDLNDLDYKGVTVGNKKNVVTVVNIDDNDNVRVVMEKVKRTASTGKKLQDVDRWANQNIEAIKAATSNTDGKKVTPWVAVIELPGGEFKLVSLRQKAGQDVNLNDDYVVNLGEKFSSAVRKNVFKNESVAMVPKYKDKTIQFDLKDAAVVNSVYSAEDIISSESFGLNTSELSQSSNEEKVNEFLNSLTPEQLKNINGNFAAFPMSTDELTADILDDYQSGMWSSIDDYLDNLKNCKS